MIAATYCSTIFNTHVLSLYSHLCIYEYIELPIYTCYISTGSMQCSRAIQSASENEDRVNSEIHSNAMIERVWRFTCRAGLNKHRDAHWDRDEASLQMHVETRIIRTWRPSSSKCWDALWGFDQFRMDMHLEDVIEQVSGFTWRPSLSEFGAWRLWLSNSGETLGGRDRASLEMQCRLWSTVLEIYFRSLLVWAWRL